MNSNKSNLTRDVLFIIMLAIAFIERLGPYSINRNLRFSMLLFWILYAFVQFAINGFQSKITSHADLKRFFLLYFVPKLVLWAYTECLILLGIIDKSLFTSNVTSFISAIAPVALLYIFRERVLLYSMISVGISYIIILLYNLLNYGFSFITETLKLNLFNDATTMGNVLELHDLSFAVGCYLLYFVLTQSRLTKSKIKYIFLFLIIILLAMKRIGIGALLLSIMLIVLLYICKNRIRIMNIIGVLGVVFSYVFVATLFDGSLFDIVSSLNLNTMGRNYYYQAAISQGEFSISFLGIGRNVLGKLLTSEFSYMNVGGVHSDILKMYIENGFILFGIWLIYNLIFLTNVLYKKYNLNAAIIYFVLTIYIFIIYVTDNVENYLTTQYIYMLLPMYFCIYQRYNKSLIVNVNMNERKVEYEKNNSNL